MSDCKNCEQLLARIDELEDQILKMGKAVEEFLEAAGVGEQLDPLRNEIIKAEERKKAMEPPADPWLGVWRAKKSLIVSNRYILEGDQINVVKIKGDSVLFEKGTTQFRGYLTSWLKENFEKVTEEGEG